MRLKFLSASLAAALMVSAAGYASADNLRAGEFSGANNHVSTGGVALVKTEQGYQVRLMGDFQLDNAPDARVAFGKDGKFIEGSDFEALKSLQGEQIYYVPAGINAEEADSIMIWCRQYSVLLANAPLQ